LVKTLFLVKTKTAVMGDMKRRKAYSVYKLFGGGGYYRKVIKK
jgi:hypothetical protein